MVTSTVKSTVISTWHLRRESPEHGFNYDYMEARLVEKGETGQTTRMIEFIYPSAEVKTYLVVTARTIWDTLILDEWNVYKKTEVAPQPEVAPL
jgi:hypothetical protein